MKFGTFEINVEECDLDFRAIAIAPSIFRVVKKLENVIIREFQ